MVRALDYREVVEVIPQGGGHGEIRAPSGNSSGMHRERIFTCNILCLPLKPSSGSGLGFWRWLTPYINPLGKLSGSGCTRSFSVCIQVHLYTRGDASLSSAWLLVVMRARSCCPCIAALYWCRDIGSLRIDRATRSSLCIFDEVS